MDNYSKLPISAVVVTFNEEQRLRTCLSSLGFCEEILIYDLGSKDNSKEIAREFNCRVFEHEKVVIVEYIRKEAADNANNDWIIYLDPDEVFPIATIPEIERLISDERIGLIGLPRKFFFLGKPLNSTYWGEINIIYRIAHRKKVIYSDLVHSSLMPKPGFYRVDLENKTEYLIIHYWVDNIISMLEKHWRYIKTEGKARYMRGNRFNLLLTISISARVILVDLIKYRGILDGVRGIFLSIFHGFYEFLSCFSLLFYQVNYGKSHKG